MHLYKMVNTALGNGSQATGQSYACNLYAYICRRKLLCISVQKEGVKKSWDMKLPICYIPVLQITHQARKYYKVLPSSNKTFNQDRHQTIRKRERKERALYCSAQHLTIKKEQYTLPLKTVQGCRGVQKTRSHYGHGKETR